MLKFLFLEQIRSQIIRQIIQSNSNFHVYKLNNIIERIIRLFLIYSLYLLPKRSLRLIKIKLKRLTAAENKNNGNCELGIFLVVINKKVLLFCGDFYRKNKK